MKINKNNLAKALVEVSVNYQGKKYNWEKLEYHQKLKWKCEAEKVIEALKLLRDKWNQPANME